MVRYEQILGEMDDYIDSCKKKNFSDVNIIVNKEELKEFISELSANTPDEIRKYDKIVSNKEAILKAAKNEASKIIENAESQRDFLVSENEIVKRAQEQGQAIVDEASAQGQEILNDAVRDANEVREGAMQYADDTLMNLENILTNAIDNISGKYESFIKAMETALEVVSANRNELHGGGAADNGAEDDFSGNDSDEASDSDDYEINGGNEITDYDDYTVNTDFLND